MFTIFAIVVSFAGGVYVGHNYYAVALAKVEAELASLKAKL